MLLRFPVIRVLFSRSHSVNSGVTRGRGGPPRVTPSSGPEVLFKTCVAMKFVDDDDYDDDDTRRENFFVGKFTKNTGEMRSDR